MARQTLNLGSGFTINSEFGNTWISKEFAAGPINSDFIEDGSSNIDVSLLTVFTTGSKASQIGRITLAFGPSGTMGDELTAAWENHGQAVKLAIQGGASVTLGGPNHSGSVVSDTDEPYVWRPSNHAAVGVWAAQVTNSSVILLTLRDGVTAPTTPTALRFRASLDGSISGSINSDLELIGTPTTDPTLNPLRFRARLAGGISGSLRATLGITGTPFVEPPVSANALKFRANLVGRIRGRINASLEIRDVPVPPTVTLLGFRAVLEGYISGGVNASLRLGSVTVRPRPRPRPRSLKFLANLDGNIYGYINANSELSLVLNSVVNLDGDLQGIINASLVVTGLYKPIINLRYESGSVILDVPTGI